ncbi:hypothetical protein HHK36_004409 [Tetracentron sinense]|uniref:Uncharacterized protein n=1 Tax=Tetracentron sinense TaxID=13715 RepID=A0A834ZUW0_TETSI|nr:hypothetical protein HHK36_004409 [Tetracentron sinense]
MHATGEKEPFEIIPDKTEYLTIEVDEDSKHCRDKYATYLQLINFFLKGRWQREKSLRRALIHTQATPSHPFRRRFVEDSSSRERTTSPTSFIAPATFPPPTFFRIRDIPLSDHPLRRNHLLRQVSSPPTSHPSPFSRYPLFLGSKFFFLPLALHDSLLFIQIRIYRSRSSDLDLQI